ncbi:hypothetical protein CBS101457_006911 [Exobasidium rhododendri]|nr:hypothetical protein CBS101457_006911 [Exobasidium rhododendri]
MTIPVLLGSLRTSGNGPGLGEHIIQRCKTQGLDARLATELFPPGSSLPTGPILDATISHLIKDASHYQDKDVQAWSRIVSDSPALIIVTPQYNWGYPGPLKNTLDHIYNEWKNKPILLITYGGHGGSKCAEQLKIVLEGGLNATLVTEPVKITLPVDFIRGDERADPSREDQKSFRLQYEPQVDAAITNLKEIVSK